MHKNITKEGVLVEKGQIWGDLDKRMPNRLAIVQDVHDGKAIMYLCTANGRIINSRREIKIAITRMHKHSTGWSLVRGASGKTTTVVPIATAISRERLAQCSVEE